MARGRPTPGGPLRAGRLGLAVVITDGRTASAGASDPPFAIQSISKVFALDMPLEKLGSALMRRVGYEPSGRPFDSVIDLELADGVPARRQGYEAVRVGRASGSRAPEAAELAEVPPVANFDTQLTMAPA